MRAAPWLSLLLPAKASACAVCFGAGNDDVARALTIGIFMLIGSVFACLGAFVYSVYKIEKNRNLAEQAAR